MKRALHKVDTKLEILERRLDVILERKTLIQTATWDSYLRNHDLFIKEVENYTRTVINVLIIFSTIF